MKKINIILVCVAAFFLVLAITTILKLERRQEIQKKTVLAQRVMRNLLMERQNIVRSVPADGLWYNMRRRRESPGILEVEIKDQNNNAVCDLKIKVSE